jgi:hypothetical protein
MTKEKFMDEEITAITQILFRHGTIELSKKFHRVASDVPGTPSSADAFAYGVHGATLNDLKSAAWMLRRLCVTMGVHGKVDCNTPLYEQAVDLLTDLEAKGYSGKDVA